MYDSTNVKRAGPFGPVHRDVNKSRGPKLIATSNTNRIIQSRTIASLGIITNGNGKHDNIIVKPRPTSSGMVNFRFGTRHITEI